MNTVLLSGFWVAWDGNVRGMGKTEKDAILACQCNGLPTSTHTFTLVSGFAEADDYWVCFENEYIEVSGFGETPHAAYGDWKHRIKNTWHTRRVERLFQSMKDAATELCTISDHEMLDVAIFKRDELRSFIAAWNAGIIGVIENGSVARYPGPATCSEEGA